ncbi:hypothetical protein AB0M95_13400 [Sphaerisporangium sp. NPDC051017]|uniref:hypothetical protein n=1 Tax=Sphaerisporangium sp. NPDC051017 TaxID=3154636 RepID=UPI003440FCB7
MESPRDRLRSRAAALGMPAVRARRDPATETATRPSRKAVDMDRITRLTAGWGPRLD